MKLKKLLYLPGTLAMILLLAACAGSLSVPKELDNGTKADLQETPTQDPPSATEGGNSPADPGKLFSEELQRAGVERVGMPIEGFNAFIYLEVFPGFEESDFDGVESLEGIYTLADGELQYLRTAGDPITSAEETISEEGYRTLLENFSARVSLEVKTAEDIAVLLETLREADSYPNSFIYEDFSIWLPENWYPYDLGTSVLFVHDPDLDLEASSATEGFAFGPYIQVVKQELSLDELLEQNLWTEDSEFIESIDDVLIGPDQRIRIVSQAGGASGQVLNYLFDAEDGRVFTVSIYPYQPGSQDTDDFEQAVQSFMINYVFDGPNGDN